jgi:sec-independent protein translocase protein TatA
MPNIGPLELIIVLVVVLLIFGPKRLPGLGRQLGTGMREFKDSITGKDKDEEERDAFGNTPQLTEASSTPAADEEPAKQPTSTPGTPGS